MHTRHPNWFSSNLLPQGLIPLGYTLEPRADNDTEQREGKNRLIVIWQKGHENPGFHYKCDGQAPNGHWFEGVGETPAQAIEDWQVNADLHLLGPVAITDLGAENPKPYLALCIYDAKDECDASLYTQAIQSGETISGGKVVATPNPKISDFFPNVKSSTGICDGTTFGTGTLDPHGYWEHGNYEAARLAEKLFPELGECWPYSEETLARWEKEKKERENEPPDPLLPVENQQARLSVDYLTSQNIDQEIMSKYGWEEGKFFPITEASRKVAMIKFPNDPHSKMFHKEGLEIQNA
jgi:hypothetical protein